MSPQTRADAAQIAPYLTHSTRTRDPKSTPTGLLRLAATGAARRRQPARQELYNDDIPDYPPPSFQEAIATPPLSVCPSTLTLPARAESDTASDSDSDGSLDIVDSSAESEHNGEASRGRTTSRGAIPDLDLTSEPPSPKQSKRRHLSLSPLRTLFPPNRATQLRERTFSAFPVPGSPYSSKAGSTSFFRSTHSFSAPSFLRLPRSPSFSKGKDREKRNAAAESIDSWVELNHLEILSASVSSPSVCWPPSSISWPPSPVEPSPLREQHLPLHDPEPVNTRQTPPPEIDCSSVPVPVIRHPVRKTPPAPTGPAPLPPSPGPSESLSTRRNIPSPLRIDTPSTLQRAAQIPLPMTPIEVNHVFPRGRASPAQMSQVSHSLSLHSPFSTPPDTPTQSRHHYPGRPLPTPPPMSPQRPQSLVDSLYDLPSPITSTSSVSCPEGLLIDFDEEVVSTPTTASEHLRDRAETLVPVPVLSAEEHLPSVGPAFSNLTELDVLVSRLNDDEDHGRGLDYDSLLLVSEILGPAPPKPKIVSEAESDSVPCLGNVELARRRITKDGRVKLKLSMLGVAVDKCGICLSQFKQGAGAALSPACRHVFHEGCLRKWLTTSQTCPTCRVTLAMLGN